MSGMDATGLSIESLQEVLDDINTQLQTTFGAFINLQPGSNFATFSGIFAERLATLWSQVQAVYFSQYPATGVGISLDRAVALVGISRKPATFSRQFGQLFFGTVGTLVPAGTTLYVNGNPTALFNTDTSVTLIAGTNEVQTLSSATSVPTSGTFELVFDGQTTTAIPYTATASTIQAALQALSNIGSGGCTVTGAWSSAFTITFTGANGLQPQPLITLAANSLTVSSTPLTPTIVEATLGVAQASTSLTAQTAGPVVAPEGTLTVLQTPIAGITSSINTVDAVPGVAVESDAALRLRQQNSVQVAGAGTIEAIRAKLLQVTNVTAVIVFENETDVTDGSSRPPHSFEAVVEGGASLDIGNTIWLTKPAGIATYGTSSQVIVDSQGVNRTINFSRPQVIPIYVSLTLTTNGSFPANGDALVQAAVVAYVNGLGIGNSVIISPGVVAAISSVPGIIGVVITMGTAPSPVGTSNISISQSQLANTQTSYIVVSP